MRCPSCGREVPANIPNCPKCGLQMMANMRNVEGLTTPLNSAGSQRTLSHQYHSPNNPSAQNYRPKGPADNRNRPNAPYTPVRRPGPGYAHTGASVAGAAVKTAGSAGLVACLISAAVVLIGIIVTLVVVTTGGFTKTPEDTWEKFETAYNNMDTRGMIACCEKKVQKAVESGNNLIGGIIGFDILGFTDLIPFASEFFDTSDYPKIDVKVLSIDYENGSNDNSELADVEIEISGDNGETTNDTIAMVKVDGEWYIAASAIANSFNF